MYCVAAWSCPSRISSGVARDPTHPRCLVLKGGPLCPASGGLTILAGQKPNEQDHSNATIQIMFGKVISGHAVINLILAHFSI